MYINKINSLTACRNAQEINELLKSLGISLTYEKLNELKRSFILNKEESDALTSKQLNSIAGGIFKLGEHYYSRKQAQLALERIDDSAVPGSAVAINSEAQPLLDKNHAKDKNEAKISELIRLYGASQSQDEFKASLQQIIDDHKKDSIIHYSNDLQKTGETKIGYFNSCGLRDAVRDIANLNCDDMDDAQLGRINNCWKANLTITLTCAAVCFTTIILNAIYMSNK